MPGARKCEPGCRCGHHPNGMLPREELAEVRRNRDRERQQKKPRATAKRREDWLKWSHGIPPEELAAMWDVQGGRCCYCERPLPSADSKLVHLDHNHACCGPRRTCQYCRRGLACQRCNMMLGLAADDPDRLELIARNFRRLNDESNARLARRPVQIELLSPDGSDAA